MKIAAESELVRHYADVQDERGSLANVCSKRTIAAIA